ncbi:A disintegrin and metalloproteinase with thrombospondin motifs 15 [Brachyhypopomus gauderio]|uniref:A disintegrin and metalloproteinase with thrombospondin motifs 15 n=1 Tax=Brachyhypopomus gauderio TaxID=698409 RepID=UPI004042D1B0
MSVGFMFFLLNLPLFTHLYLCMEIDFCKPVQLDDENAPYQSWGSRPDRVVFRISAFNQDFYLNVLPDSGFLAPDVIHVNHFSTTTTSGSDLRRCFYSGDVNSDASSYATISLCRGVQGAFFHSGTDYLFWHRGNETAEGLKTSAEKTHIIRRRRHVIHPENSVSRCGVSSDVNRGAVESLEKHPHLTGHTKRQTQRALNVNTRPKRFASLPRYIEVLIVADGSMVKFHGDDLEHYLLTLMSIAAQLYKHPSILNIMHIVVVKILVIDEPEEGPKISSNAALTLRTFCAWQKKLNKITDKHPEHWDTAILFTKQDLCGATTCETLGMADVGTVCDPRRSCSVIEDDGLPSAFTTAHELGHVLNMPHDNVKACEEVFGKLKDNHMMSPTLVQVDRTSPWSVCSAAIITDFLDSGHGDCLLDEPQKLLALPKDPPGSVYSLSRQCQLAFGSGSKPCPYMQACAKLWCTGQARGHLVCQTRHFPWADGTSCSNKKTCHRGTCVDRSIISTAKIDGQWGKWGAYGSCSRTCGGGVQLAKRECNSPAPENGGNYCGGQRVKFRSCHLDSCTASGKSFREEQCERFNGISLNTNRLSSSVTWVPKYSGISLKDRCKLICRANGTGYFYMLAPKVVDGTLCSPDTSAICVQGKCVKAGCDSKLRSNMKFDKCGVCGGDNQNCKKVSGVFTKPIHGYNFVVSLPVGASNMDIRQRGYRGLVNDDNYLAVKNAHGEYLLNGNYVVSAVERDIVVKGGLLRYSGSSTAVEILQAARPLQEPLTVEVLSVGKMTPPRVRYFYYLTKNSKEEKVQKKAERIHDQNSILVGGRKMEPKKPAYQKPSCQWVTGDWEECSVSCGNGFQKRLIHCLDSEGRVSTYCDRVQKPSVVRVCGDPCPVWSTGEWSACSKSCGKGFRRRLLRCVSTSGLLLPRHQCSGRRKPQELDLCHVQPCW